MIEIEINKNEFNNIYRKMGKIQNGMQKVFTRFSMEVANQLQDNVSNKILKVRTGRLRSSIQSRVSGEGWAMQAMIGSGVRNGKRVTYANILEDGGTIRPVSGQYLTIPLGAAKTSAGAPRFSARDVMNGMTPYTTSVILDGIIYGVTGNKTSKLTPLFVLKRSVKIPAFRYMATTVRQMSTGKSTILDQIAKNVIEKEMAS
ncbi:MAG TPA: HK97 gp10 family phage protein [Candidatus Omnitrophota bacterium]|nr:HK97 gp10 family phage protein [Candidatus Omnitrophota bacterium]